MSTFSPNLNIEEVARNADVGTWDTPTNNNWSIVDSALGAQASISLNNANVVLSAAQFQSKLLTFFSTLTGSVSITFPTSFQKSYEIQNLCTGSSAFTITLGTTSGSQVICAPPGETVDVFNDGANLKYKNLGRIGSYIDYAGGSVPGWITGCSVPPYLDCNGQTFSAAVFPVLALVLNSTTTPDFRGRTAHYLNEGTGRLTSAGAGINGDANFAAGGNNGITLGTSHVPSLSGTNTITVFTSGSYSIPVAAPGFAIDNQLAANGAPGTAQYCPATGGSAVWSNQNQLSGSNSITVNSGGGSQIVQATAPGIVAGMRLIRAG